MRTFLPIPLLTLSVLLHAQTNTDELKDFAAYDLQPGTRTLFDDALVNDKMGAAPVAWTIEGGTAVVAGTEDHYVDVLEYYTKLSPKLSAKVLPDSFVVEYDAWLAAGYDGNPGVEVHLMKGDAEIVVTPNRDHARILFPGGEENGETPEDLRGGRFYDRWNHIAVAYMGGAVTVYEAQHKVTHAAACSLRPDRIVITGNTSDGMPLRFKNFRITTGFPNNAVKKAMDKGKFITHAIRFDVGRADLKPESIVVLNELASYLKANPAARFEIGGHTDSDGDDAMNLRLSEARAEAVRKQLVRMGAADAQLTSKGYGETKPLMPNTSSEGKAENRRVEFERLP